MGTDTALPGISPEVLTGAYAMGTVIKSTIDVTFNLAGAYAMGTAHQRLDGVQLLRLMQATSARRRASGASASAGAQGAYPC